MNAPLTDNLYRALYNMMLVDPKVAYEAITGTCTWPPLECDKLDMGDALWNLERDAIDLVKDDEELSNLFPSGGRDTVGSIKLKAARDAIMAIRQKHIEKVSAPDPFDERPHRQSMSRGWQKVL